MKKNIILITLLSTGICSAKLELSDSQFLDYKSAMENENVVQGGPNPVGSGFNYQGELIDAGTAANGNYDFSFRLFDANTGGTQVGGNEIKGNRPVVNGLFSIEDIDFGDAAYTGNELWLSVTVRETGDPGSETNLTPRQRLHAVPYAVQAEFGAGSSPWTVDGNNISYMAGNAAIGTTASDTSGALIVQADTGNVLRARVGNSTKFYVDNNGGTSIGSFSSPPTDGLRVEGRTSLQDHVLVDGNVGINSGSLLNSTLQAAVHIESTSSEGRALFVSSNIGQFGADITLGGNGSSNSTDEGVISTDQRYPGSDMWLISNDAVIIRLDQDNNESGEFEIRQSTNSTVFRVDENGVVQQNGTTIHASDKRLKTDIVELPYGLAEILILKPKTYNWKSYEKEYKSFGFLAQDVQKIIKEIVNIGDDPDKTLGLSYIELIPVLVKGMQEQQAIIDDQNKKIDQLMMFFEKRQSNKSR